MQAAARSGAAVQRKAVAWTLTTSAYFQRRKKEAESRDFGDMEAIYLQKFDTDWARVAGKERFVAMVGRSDKELLATDRVELQRGAAPLPAPVAAAHADLPHTRHTCCVTTLACVALCIA